MEDTPYQAEELTGTHSSVGTLHLGRVVWMKKDLQEQTTDQRVPVYAEGVGVVLLNRRSLRLSS